MKRVFLLEVEVCQKETKESALTMSKRRLPYEAKRNAEDQGLKV